ncbi:GerMN domain-containing protein [Schaalia sp. 19OD2882]|nr:GerMN domain-containing protein [Schaalia sp. 19OD2882]
MTRVPGRRPRAWRTPAVSAALALVLSVSACSALPTSSAPQAFDVEVPDSPPLVLSAGGPAEGATAQELVQGFLLACAAGASDDFATARLHLTTASAQSWNPQAGVQIFPTDATPVISTPTEAEKATRTTVSLEVPAVASVDSHGILTRAPASSVSATFHLVRENGQWRIDAPDDGIVVSQASFLATHDLVNLQFPTAAGDALVADPRWYPARRLATHLVQGLVEGPRESLTTVLQNAVPAGTVLDSRGVEVTDGLAKVLLSGQAPTGRAAALMRWEIEQTLTAVPAISGVLVSVSGQELVGASPPGPDYSLDAALVLTDQGLGSWTAGTIRPHLAPNGPGDAASDLALGPLGDSPVVWREADTLTISAASGLQRRRIHVKAAPVHVSVDRYGWVWVPASAAAAAAAGGGGVDGAEDLGALATARPMVALDANGRTAVPELPSDVAQGLVRVHVSPDGSRVLLLRSFGGATGLWSAVVERSGDGTPMGLGQVEPVPALAAGVVDVSWAGPSRFVALVNETPGTADSATSMFTVDFGGLASSAPAPAHVVSISAGPAASSLVVTLDDGTRHTRSGALWQPVASTVKDLRFPG